MSLRSTEVFFFLTVCTALAWAEQNCTCGLHIPERVVTFKDCQKQPANWRSHDHPDLGITGDCLTQFKVPVNTMRCYKWRTGENCYSGFQLRCFMRNRSQLEEDIMVGPCNRSATMVSPGYCYTNSEPYYSNNNFCIYNISLNCPGETVNLTSKLTDYGLADGETCEDYLWFDTSSTGHPQKLCGDKIIGFKDNLHTQSFVGILWNNRVNSEGKFEIEARCTGHPIPTAEPDSSGDCSHLINKLT